MKHWPPQKHRRPDHRRVPAFLPVPLRTRADGWTPARQAAFLGALAETRSVSAAARKVRMARETAYRLRKLPGAESFAAAWDAVLGRVTPGRRKVTPEERARRAIEGLLKPVMYRGKHVATARKADNSALLGHLAQLDRATRNLEPLWGRSQRFTSRSRSTSPVADE
jgi:DNA-binding phage protein